MLGFTIINFTNYVYVYVIRCVSPCTATSMWSIVRPVEFQISRHTLAAMVLFAPPTSEQWYLLLAPFCLWQIVPYSPHLPEELETIYLDRKNFTS
jgi:hypothetical protein